MQVRIGTAGWSYDDWRGPFYPATLPKAAWLSHYAKFFDFTEINATFYNVPESSTIRAWDQAVPEEFRFAVKVWQRVTHETGSSPELESLGQFLDALGPLHDKQRTGMTSWLTSVHWPGGWTSVTSS
jgi:uncharacterized protein YecE (DUF72 family)